MEDHVDVDIRLPLPLGVVAGLMDAAGQMWPDGTARTDAPSGFMRLRVPVVDPVPVELDETPVASDDPELLAWTGDQLKIRHEEICKTHGAVLFAMMDATDEAVNYIENEIVDPSTGRRSVVIVMTVDGKTPHALRAEAIVERDAALARVAELEAQLSAGRMDRGHR